MRNLGSNTMDQGFEITPFDLSGLSWPSVGRRRPSRLSLPSLAIDTWRGGEKTGRHRVRRGIRGPSADEIAIRPAKAERVCMVSPLEEDEFELSVPGLRGNIFYTPWSPDPPASGVRAGF